MNTNTFNLIEEKKLQKFVNLQREIEILQDSLKDLENEISKDLNAGKIPAKNSDFNAYIKESVKNTVSWKNLFLTHVKNGEKLAERFKTEKISEKLVVSYK